MKEIKVPQLGVNDKNATLQEWHVKNSQKINEGDILCSLETSKMVFEVNAEDSGYIKIVVDEGKEVAVQDIIGYIAASLEEISSIKIEQDTAEKKEIKATKKAIEIAKKYDINLGKVMGTDGVIKEKDVLKYYNDTNKSSIAEENDFVGIVPELEKGNIDETFIRLVEKDDKFKYLSSDLKIALYRKHGAVIGENVTIGNGTIILAKRIVIDNGCKIGSECFIKVDSFYLGPMGVIGNSANIVTRRVYIEDVFFSGNNIIIGGGGAFGKDSGLKVGKNCLISSDCIINTGSPVVLENTVGLSPRVSVFTHSHWQNVLEGYKSNFGPVIIREGSYITGNVMITPGVKIGKGATVLANSLVLENVDERSIVCGVPAKKVSSITSEVSIEKKDRIFKRIFEELKSDLKDRGIESDKIIYAIDLPKAPISSKTVYIGFNLPDSLIKNAESKNEVTVFDISNSKVYGKMDRVHDEIRNFLRKRGIRFSPIHWRYTCDEGFYNQ